jgi:hypothetical protein
MKNGKMLLNKVFLIFKNQIIDVKLHKDKHMNQLHIYGLYNLFLLLRLKSIICDFKKNSK